VAQVLLLFSGVEGHLLSQGILVGYREHLLRCPGVFRGELMNQGRVSEPLLEEHNNRFVVNFWDDVPLVVEPLDEFLEGLSFCLDDVANSQLTPEHAHAGRKLLVNS
jgi:hypothetical protein